MSDSALHDQITAVHALAEELTKTIDLACALAECGRAIDLTGFDHRVGLLCAKSLDLPPDEGRCMRPHLVALSRSIDALSAAMAAHAAPSG